MATPQGTERGQATATPGSPPARFGLTWRAVTLGVLAVAVTVWLVSYAELVTGQIMIGYLQLPPVVVFLLFVLAGVNHLLRRLRRGRELTSAELAIVYTMMLPAAMIASHGMMQRILPVMASGNYFATLTNGWRELFFAHTPAWLVAWDPHGPPDQPAVRAFYEGLKRGQPLPWTVWIAPLCAWLLLMALVYGAFLAMSAILRKQWMESERLPFPLVQLPLDLIGGPDESDAFFLNRLTWAGFVLPFLIFNLNGLHNILPGWPSVTLTLSLNDYLSVPPWNGMSLLMLNLSFAAVGFFYLLPTELLFSLWFFFLVGKLQEIVAASAGFQTPGAPHAAAHLFVAVETEGAWITLAVVFFLLARPHLMAVWRAAVSPGAAARGADEMLSYRAAFWTLVVCCLGIVAWCVAAGMAAWLAVWVFGLYLFVQAIIIARSTAEAGMIMAEGSWMPTDLLTLATPHYTLGAANLTVLSYTDAVFTRDLRGLILTAFLDSERLADSVRLKRRSLLWALLIGMGVAVVLAAALQLWLPYHRGALTLYDYVYQSNATQFFRENAAALHAANPTPSYGAPWFFLAGVVVTAALSLLRTRLAWWPLQPLGFALCASWTVIVFWFSMLTSWIVKGCILRYGGMRLYRQARPFFIGLILGELTAAVEWTLISSIAHTQAPTFPWP